MQLLATWYARALLSPRRGPRPRTGYSFWQRYWVALTGSYLADPSRSPSSTQPRAVPKQADKTIPSRHSNSIGSQAADRIRSMWKLAAMVLGAIAAGVVTVHFAGEITVTSLGYRPNPVAVGPTFASAGPTGVAGMGGAAGGGAAGPTRPVPIGGVLRSFAIPLTSGVAPGAVVGVDLANGKRFGDESSADIVYGLTGSEPSLFAGTYSKISVYDGPSLVSAADCLNAVKRNPAPAPITDLYSGLELCVQTPNAVAFLQQIRPLRANGTLFLREWFWPDQN